jgi:hypothetical protein
MKIDLSWIFLGLLALSFGGCAGLSTIGDKYESAERYKADRYLEGVKFKARLEAGEVVR